MVGTDMLRAGARLLMTIVSVTLLAAPPCAGAREAGKRCPKLDTGAGWPAEITALRARRGGETTEDARTLAIALPALGEAYYFTKAGHPAHPARAHKVISVIENRAVKVHVEGTFNGSRRAFDAWLKRLAADDRLGLGN